MENATLLEWTDTVDVVGRTKQHSFMCSSWTTFSSTISSAELLCLNRQRTVHNITQHSTRSQAQEHTQGGFANTWLTTRAYGRRHAVPSTADPTVRHNRSRQLPPAKEQRSSLMCCHPGLPPGVIVGATDLTIMMMMVINAAEQTTTYSLIVAILECDFCARHACHAAQPTLQVVLAPLQDLHTRFTNELEWIREVNLYLPDLPLESSWSNYCSTNILAINACYLE